MNFHPVTRGNIRKGDHRQNGPAAASKNRRWYRVPDYYAGLPVNAYADLKFRRQTRPRLRTAPIHSSPG